MSLTTKNFSVSIYSFLFVKDIDVPIFLQGVQDKLNKDFIQETKNLHPDVLSYSESILSMDIELQFSQTTLQASAIQLSLKLEEAIASLFISDIFTGI